MTTFPIRRVDRNQAEAMETLGSKPKFWFRVGEARWLFKADDRGTGEDWAEIVASELCECLGLPHVVYELAAEYDGERLVLPGVVCENIAYPPVSLELGNQLLLARDPEYPIAQRFKVRQHTIDAVAEVVGGLEPPPPEWLHRLPAGARSALDIFAGYVMLDAWIANQDRHHENWAALRSDRLCLAPTFDHGAALARNLNDAERSERLMTRDRNRTVAAFAERARSAFFAAVTNPRPLGTLEAFVALAQRVPAASAVWLERMGQVNRDVLQAILDRIPVERMSDTCRRFTLELLLFNQQRLLR